MTELQTELKSKTSELQETQMHLLDLKSQIIERDGHVKELLDKLALKGEETAELSSRLIDLKNYILDQQLFETKYMVTRVPITTIVWSPNLKAAMSDQEA